jgi:hypothetical protein
MVAHAQGVERAICDSRAMEEEIFAFFPGDEPVAAICHRLDRALCHGVSLRLLILWGLAGVDGEQLTALALPDESHLAGLPPGVGNLLVKPLAHLDGVWYPPSPPPTALRQGDRWC